MLIALILAAAATPAPASSAPSLASLQTIASVRSTPVCSALRTKVGPAIAALLDNDATLGLAGPYFDKTYRDELLTPQWGWGQPSVETFLNRGRMESLIGPVAGNLKRIDELLADKVFFEPQLAKIKAALESAETQQKSALNVISGYDATSQTWEILNAGKTPLAVSQPSPRIFSTFDSTGMFGGAQPLKMQGPRETPGRFDTSLAYSPYAPFARAVATFLAQGSDLESAAASSISPVVTSCRI